MPTYEYECLECKHRFDVFQSITDESVKKCEKCGKDVRKIFGTAGIIFKGEGFYVNDYKKNGAANNTGKNAKKEKSDACSTCDASCSAAG